MDPPALINDGSFGSGSANSYNLAQIWEYPTDAGGDVGEASDGFGMRDEAVEDSIVVDQGGSHGSSGRKRRDAPAAQEDESLEIVSASGGNDMNNGNGRRLKTRKSRAEIRDSKAEGEASSGKGIEQNLQPLEPPKQDYIHLRARRGEATDSHSLAERARREKISERMKILQDLVPTCNKVIGKAVVLDEIINYIQSLQSQVEFLSMKLEAVNSRMRPSIEAFP